MSRRNVSAALMFDFCWATRLINCGLSLCCLYGGLVLSSKVESKSLEANRSLVGWATGPELDCLSNIASSPEGFDDCGVLTCVGERLALPVPVRGLPSVA